MEHTANTETDNAIIVNSIINSHKKTATLLLNAARHFMQAAWFQRMGEEEKATACTNSGRKAISRANEVQGECLWI